MKYRYTGFEPGSVTVSRGRSQCLREIWPIIAAPRGENWSPSPTVLAVALIENEQAARRCWFEPRQQRRSPPRRDFRSATLSGTRRGACRPLDPPTFGKRASQSLLRPSRRQHGWSRPFPDGRQPAVSAPTPDCCIDPAVGGDEPRRRRRVGCGAAGRGEAAAAAGDGEVFAQGPRGPALSKRAACAATHKSNSDRRERRTRAPAQKQRS